MVEQPTISIQRTSMLNSINFVGNTLNKVGIDPFQINANKVIKKAVKKSGFKEAIPKNIIEGLNKMVDSLNNDGNDRPLKNRYTLFLNYQVVPHEPNKHPLQN